MSNNLFVRYYQQVFKNSIREPPTAEEIIEHGHVICKEFISKKLKKCNLIKMQSTNTTRNKSQSFSDVFTLHSVNAISNLMLGANMNSKSNEMLQKTSENLEEIGIQLEGMYPDLYKGISSQMGINITCEPEMVIKAYQLFSNSILNNYTDSKLYWGKVVSLLCVSAGLSVECARLGRWDIISKIIDSFDKLVAQYLVTWLIEQNGWSIPPELLPNRSSKVKMFFLILSTFLAIFLCVLFVAYHTY